jgi:hypothetical protein
MFQKVLSGVGVTFKTGSGLDDLIYCTLYIHNSGLQATQRYRHTFSSPLHTHQGSQSSLVVSWQRIYNSLTVSAAHMKSSFHSLIPFLPSLLNHSTVTSRNSLNSVLQLPTLEFDSIQFQAHILVGGCPETRLLPASELFLITTLHGSRGKHRLLLSRIILGVFTDPLASNGCTRRSKLLESDSLKLITDESPYT